MAIKRFFFGLILLTAFSLFCNAEKKQTADYFFEIDGRQIIFTQVFNWEPVDGALYYDLSIFNEETPSEIQKVRCEQPTAEVRLKPGRYKYRIEVFNLLGQPDIQSEWISCEIKQAVAPVIKGISPKIIYIEDETAKIVLTGKDITADCKITITNSLKKEITPVITKRTDTSVTFSLENPKDMIGWPWRITITHPSGLSDRSEPFLVKYRRSFDFYAGLGWSPFLPVSDKWYLRHWPKKGFPISFTGTLGVIFLKRPFGFFGLEFRSVFRDSSIKTDAIQIKNYYSLNALHFVYEYWFAGNWAVFTRTGGGLSFGSFKIMTEEEADASYKTYDFYYSAGVGLRWRFHAFAYADAGVHWQQILHKKLALGGFVPEISIGFRY